MKEVDEESSEPLVAVALAVRTRGLRGEIVADLLTDFPERFEGVQTLVVVRPDKSRGIVELEDYWFQKDRIILKLKGYDDLETSKVLVGCEFAVPEAERMPLAEGSFYEWELQGCQVQTVQGDEVGRVKAVLRTGGVEMLVVTGDNDQDFLVPLAESIVVEIDIERRIIRIDPPQGLLEL